MSSLSGPFILRAIATSLLMLAILLAGILAFGLLPVSSLPQVEYPTMRVMTFYPGASPDVMASSVTAPLEKQFGQMPGLTQMTSMSGVGASQITLQFALDMSLDVAEQEVQAAINAAANFLPPQLPNPPIYSKVNPADTPIMTLALTSSSLPLFAVEDLAETRLAQKISQVSGVGLVSISGGQRSAIRIQADAKQLASQGFSLEDLRQVLVSANVNSAKGSFDGPHLAYTINANDQLFSAKDYAPIIVAYHQGAPVRLSDVAQIKDEVENNQLAAWMNTQPAIILTIQRQPGANIIQVVDQIQKLLPRLQASLPPSVHLQIVTDRTKTIQSSIHDVQLELLLSVFLVVAVIFVFLRKASATLIPSIAVPIALIGTFAAMYLLGFSINNLTLMALTIASGFVVDDAIVMIENIMRYIEQGDTPFEAAIKGADQIGFTILSLTVSLIAVLIPLLFMSDVVGRLFREFALTLSVTILISAFVSLTLTPMLCSRLLKKETSPVMHLNKLTEEKAKTEKTFLEKLIERYADSLNLVLDNQYKTRIIFLMTLFLTGILLLFISKDFFPIQDTGLIQATTEARQSLSFSEMTKEQQAVTKKILADPAVESVTSFIGIDGNNMTLKTGRLLINLKPLSQRKISATEVIRRLQTQLDSADTMHLFMQPVQDLTIDTRVSRTQYQYSLNAPDSALVSFWSNRLLAELKKLSLLQDVASDEQNLGRQTYIQIDRETASRLGVSTQLIVDALYDAFGQRQISTIFTQRNQYHVILELSPSRQQSGLQALNSIYLNPNNTTTHSNNLNPTNLNSSVTPNNGVNVRNTPLQGSIPLSTMIKVSTQLAPLVINRQGQFPVTTLSFNLAPHTALGSAMNAITEVTQKLHVPESVQTDFEGAAKIFQHSLANEAWLVIAAIIVVYIVLGVLYESYIHPLTILSTLPSASAGALMALILTHHQLSIIALIGIILLIGIVMKNAILMIDFALEQERRYQKSAREAIFQAARLRFRPILMTTCAALLGAVPLALGGGMGAELRQPLGIAIIGGLLLSQLLTLYSTPVIYLTFDALARKFGFMKSHPFTESIKDTP